MIEVIVSDDFAEAVVIRGENLATLKVPTLATYVEIMDQAGDQLTWSEALYLHDLWSNDLYERDFERVENGWRVTLKDYIKEKFDSSIKKSTTRVFGLPPQAQ